MQRYNNVQKALRKVNFLGNIETEAASGQCQETVTRESNNQK